MEAELTSRANDSESRDSNSKTKTKTNKLQSTNADEAKLISILTGKASSGSTNQLINPQIRQLSNLSAVLQAYQSDSNH